MAENSWLARLTGVRLPATPSSSAAEARPSALAAPSLWWRHLSTGQRELLALGALGLCLAVYYLSPWLLVTALAGLVFLALAVRWPALALILVAGALPFFYRPKELRGLQFSLAEFVLFAVTAAVALRGLAAWWRAGRPLPLARWREAPGLFWRALGQQPFALPALALLIVATGSLALPLGASWKYAFREWRTVIVEPIGFFFLFVALARERRHVWWTVDVLVIVAAFVGRFGVGQFLFQQGTWDLQGVSRVSSIYPSATALSLYLSRIVPIAICLVLFLPRGPRRWGYALLLAPLGLGLILTWARGAWLGVAVGVLAVLLLGRSRKITIPLAVATALGVVLLQFGRTDSAGSAVSRLNIWSAAWQVIRDHPLFGIGLDQFLYLDRKEYPIPDSRFMAIAHPHNLILDVWLRLGLLGLAVFAWLLIGAYRLLWQAWRRLAPSPDRALVLALIASLTAFLVHGLVDMAFFVQDLALLFWLTLGLAATLARQAPGTLRPANDRPPAQFPHAARPGPTRDRKLSGPLTGRARLH